MDKIFHYISRENLKETTIDGRLMTKSRDLTDTTDREDKSTSIISRYYTRR